MNYLENCTNRLQDNERGRIQHAVTKTQLISTHPKSWTSTMMKKEGLFIYNIIVDRFRKWTVDENGRCQGWSGGEVHRLWRSDWKTIHLRKFVWLKLLGHSCSTGFFTRLLWVLSSKYEFLPKIQVRCKSCWVPSHPGC